MKLTSILGCFHFHYDFGGTLWMLSLVEFLPPSFLGFYYICPVVYLLYAHELDHLLNLFHFLFNHVDFSCLNFSLQLSYILFHVCLWFVPQDIVYASYVVKVIGYLSPLDSMPCRWKESRVRVSVSS